MARLHTGNSSFEQAKEDEPENEIVTVQRNIARPV